MALDEERRQFIRTELDQVVVLRKSSTMETNIPVQVTVTNFSNGGAFLLTDEPFDIGSILEFEMKLTEYTSRMSITARVRWCRVEDPCGIGVEFLEAVPASPE